MLVAECRAENFASRQRPCANCLIHPVCLSSLHETRLCTPPQLSQRQSVDHPGSPRLAAATPRTLCTWLVDRRTRTPSAITDGTRFPTHTHTYAHTCARTTSSRSPANICAQRNRRGKSQQQVPHTPPRDATGTTTHAQVRTHARTHAESRAASFRSQL